nr:PAS domain S-box protein [uncultured Flavobacterium sp.]
MSIKEKNGDKEVILSQEKNLSNTADFQYNEKQHTEIQHLQEQLKTKEQQLNSYINAVDSTNASIEFDLDANIINANENFLEIMGYSKAELIGKNHTILVDPSCS